VPTLPTVGTVLGTQPNRNILFVLPPLAGQLRRPYIYALAKLFKDLGMFIDADEILSFRRIASQVEELLEYWFLIRKVQMLFYVRTAVRL
jgi:hypothetical protein